MNAEHIPRGYDAGRRDRSSPYKFESPTLPTFEKPTDVIFYLRNVTESTPLYVVGGDIRRVPIVDPNGKQIAEQVQKETKLLLPDQTIGVQAQHWPEIESMLQKHAKDGLRYFEIELSGAEESAEQLYERLAAKDPKRAADLDKKIARARAGED